MDYSTVVAGLMLIVCVGWFTGLLFWLIVSARVHSQRDVDDGWIDFNLRERGYDPQDTGPPTLIDSEATKLRMG